MLKEPREYTLLGPNGHSRPNSSITQATNFCIRHDVLSGANYKSLTIYFDLKNIYAPVAAHETICRIIAVTAASSLVLEGADVKSAYLYSKLDGTILIEQTTNSTQIPAKPDYLCELAQFRVPIKLETSEALSWAVTWGHRDLPFLKLISMSILSETIYPSSYYCSFLIICYLPPTIVIYLKSSKTATTKYLWCYRELKSFIGWSILRNDNGIHNTPFEMIWIHILQRLFHLSCNKCTCDLCKLYHEAESLFFPTSSLQINHRKHILPHSLKQARSHLRGVSVNTLLPSSWLYI